MSTLTELGTFKDFEVIWVDRFTHQPKDMENVTVEIYHYSEAKPAQIVVPNREPYFFTEGINDTVNIGSLIPASGYLVDKDFVLELSLIATDLTNLGCPPNDFVVCGTNNKVSIVNGRKVFALSACELASLINLEASGYSASTQDGYLVLTHDFIGSGTVLQVGAGTFNGVVGLLYGEEYYGSDMSYIYDLNPVTMQWVSTGRYVCTAVPIIDPPYKIGERYFVMYRSIEPVLQKPEIHQEDFTVISKLTPPRNLFFSFIK